MTPVTSSSLVPTSASNESHTRSDELPARSRYAIHRVSHSFRRASRSFQIHNPRVSHLCRRASRSFQIRNSRSRSTEDKQPPCSASTTTRSRGKKTQRRSATMFAVFLLCVLRARMDERTCIRVITVDVTSSVQAEKQVQCCGNVDGQAQTLLLTRVAKTTSTWRLSALPTCALTLSRKCLINTLKQFVLALRDPHLLWQPQQAARQAAWLKPDIRIFVRTANNLDIKQ